MKPMDSANRACRCPLIAATLLVNLSSFAFGGSDRHAMPGDTAVVATVGRLAITVGEFRENYEFGPSFVKHFADPKAAHLRFLINEKLIALDGYVHGVDTVGSLKRMLEEIEDDLAVTEWYRHELAPLIHVDSSRVARGIEEKTVRLTFRSLFTESEQKLRSVQCFLDSVLSFDSLFTSLRDDPNFSLNEVTTDFFSVYEDSPRVAETLAHMKPGTCSEIIKTGSGFTLVRLDAVMKNLITTQTEYAKMWNAVERRFARGFLDSITVSFARKVMEGCRPTISGEALKAVFTLFSAATLPPPFAAPMEKLGRELVHSEVALPEDRGHQTLVASACDSFTIEDFARWYSYRRFKVDFSRHTASTLQSVRELIFTMVRDKRMIALARAGGYENDPQVQFEMNAWKSKLSYWSRISAVLKQPAITEGEVQRFYAEHKHRYERDAKGTHFRYEQVKEKVMNDLTLVENNKRLFHYLNSLRQQFPVWVNETVLRSVHLSDESLSRKIDVMIVKKGGTLARRAFPSIDTEWQFFQ